jgi:PIN domain nuclease of toxin-antitoxin system
VNILLDTHTFIWIIQNDKHLSKKAKEVFLDTENTLFFSMASYWEMCIKQSLGKLELSKNWQKMFDDELLHNGIKWLGIEKTHCQEILELPFHHKDPFDRLLIAQARVENFSMLTVDENIHLYDVETIW